MISIIIIIIIIMYTLREIVDASKLFFFNYSKTSLMIATIISRN